MSPASERRRARREAAAADRAEARGRIAANRPQHPLSDLGALAARYRADAHRDAEDGQAQREPTVP